MGRAGRIWLSAVLVVAMIAAQLPAYLLTSDRAADASSIHTPAPAAVAATASGSLEPAPDRADRSLQNGGTAAAQSRVAAGYGKLPMAFEPSTGSADFVARGDGYLVTTSAAGAILWLRNAEVAKTDGDSRLADADPSRPAYSAVRMRLVGGDSSAAVIGDVALPGRLNYIIGNDPSAWRTNVATFAKVHYASVWPGIDLAYYGNQRQLEFDFVLSPGADPSTIRLAFDGASDLAVLDTGELRVGVGDGAVTVRQPAVYQDLDGARHELSAAYVLDGDVVGLRVDGYDSSRALVIDPVISYSTYLGGLNADTLGGLAVDSSGQAYLVGSTQSNPFPTTAGAFDTTAPSAPANTDIFLTVLNASGTAIVYSTYLGGSNEDDATGVALDAAGNVYLTGRTISPNFPTTSGSYSTSGHGGYDAFVTEVSATGAALAYSTLLGGQLDDVANAIAVGADGTAYITGTTSSSDFPTTVPGSAYGGGTSDAFVTRLNAGGSALSYSRYLGGAGPPSTDAGPRLGDQGKGIALDGVGNAYVTGWSDSESGFPTTSGTISPNHHADSDPSGYSDAFVTKVSSTGGLFYSTFLGGSRTDGGNAIAVDASGDAYVTGGTASFDFPVGNTVTSYGFGGDGFITKLDAAGSAVIYSGYIHGADSAYDTGLSIAVTSGYAEVGGVTDSVSFPLVGATQGTRGGSRDAFVSEFNTNSAGAGSLTFSTYLGGANDETSVAVAVGPTGLHVAGTTSSTNLFTTSGAYDTSSNGSSDVFADLIVPGTSLPDLIVTSFTAPATIRSGQTANYSWTIKNVGTATAVAGANFWADQVWLSSSPTSISGAAGAGGIVAAQSLAPGQSYTRTFSATLPTLAPGRYYFVLQTDSNGQITESDETNNLFAVPTVVPYTIGQVGPAQPNSGAQNCTTCTTLQSATDPASPSYAAPVDGTITSWSVQGPTDTCGDCSVKLRIFRPLGSGEFTTVAESATQVIDTGLKTFAVSIPVKAGDLLGIDATNGLRWYPGNTGDDITFVVGDPVPGATTTGLCSGGTTDLCRFGGRSGNRLNIAATIVPGGAITGVARCGDIIGTGVVLRSGSVTVDQQTGLVNGAFAFTNTAPNSTYQLDYSADATINVPVLVAGPPPPPVTCSVTVTTDAIGNATAPAGSFVPDLGNHTWTSALRLDPQESATPGVIKFGQADYVAKTGQSDWYVVHVAPGQKILVKLTGTGNLALPADLSLALFKDIKAYLAAQNASLATDPLQTIQNTDASTSPDALSPDALSPDALSPDALSPDALSPDALSPDALSPDALSPDELSPDELSPDALSPDALSPDALSPDALSPDAYSGAQTATILRISAHEGTSPEQIIQDTWSNTGDFYIRVRGHNGAYSATDGFQLTAEITSTACTGVALQSFSATPGPAVVPPAVGPTTLILTNSARFGGVAANYAAKLSAFAARSDVNGLVLDLATNTGLAPAYAQWDSNVTCPAAANIVADAIKALVDQYRPSLKYVVLAGGDHVIPYFRTPDQAGLGIESGFDPGLFQDTASEASLQFGYTLTQDSYGTRFPIAHFDHSFFMPDLPVGRLVESSTDIIAVLDAYTAANGVVYVAGGHAVDSGYDFLSDTATFIQTSLAPSLTVDPLIQLRGQAPWTADQLRTKLFAQHNDIVSLNGHFSANTLLASDFATRITSDEVAQFMALFTNSLVISTGCHSGYNIVDPEAKASTRNVDWVQSLARAGAETIGSTGYAYGDTDFMKYTELILGNFTTELRYDTGAIAIGQALVNAKRAYAASLPALRGIDEKALMEATLYGLPMWSIDLGTNGRLVRPGTGSGISPVPTDVNGLSTATVTPSYTLNRQPASGNGDAGVYYDADGNVAVSPATPVLPLTTQNVGVAGTSARGVVLMDATYVDEGNVTPFTDVAGTELAGLHPGFASPVFAPVRTFALNNLSGITTFVTTPAQFKTSGPNSGTLRRWTSESFQLFYSSRIDAAAAFAGSPVVYRVDVTPGTGGAVRFAATVGALADPGFAGAYLTYTAEQGDQYGKWHSVAMTQSGPDLVTGQGVTRTYAAEVLPGAGGTAADLRAFVQIVGGNGLVSMNTNNGEYYELVPETATTSSPKQTTTLTVSAPAHVAYLGSTTVSATLTGGGSANAGLPVTVMLGSQSAGAITNAFGVASATFIVNTPPGATTVGASFAEDATHLASSASAPFTVDQAAPSLSGTPVSMQFTDSAVIATLHLGGSSDPQSVTLATNGTTIATLSDPLGRIRLDTRDLPLTPGANSVVVSFGGNDRFTATSTTVQVTQTAEDATVTLPAFAPQPVGTLPVTAQVAQNTDGSLGDLSKAKVTFVLRNEGGTVVNTIISSVSATGSSSATFAGVGAGLYHVEATVTGGYFTSPLGYAIAVIYDSSTFATGGGWLLTTTSSTGLVAGKKANFGFNAKYQTGTTIPTGSVEFTAKESNVTFKATSFDWLVISSGRAELQGSGTVNGGGIYGFRLVAVDGSPDTFELRVWNASTSYDLPLYKVSVALGGGNIAIH